MDETCLASVRAQYEQYPYPPRDPADERQRLLEIHIDRLATINHYCFGGEHTFENARVLVAGGGTGDSTIYLAEQLHSRNAEIVYLDISSSSMEIAQRRAAIRGLANIRWLHGSILSLSPEAVGCFDYISCTGVLHHLESPAEGLRKLKSVLKPSGGMGLMIYGKYGRTGVYQMQKLMRLINRNETDLAAKIENTRRMLGQLPQSNWFRHNELYLNDHKRLGDSGLVDLLLHEQDVAFSIEEVHALLAEADLHFVEFTDVKMRMAYRPQTYLRDPVLLQKVAGLDQLTQQSIAELLVGLFMKHDFYASPRADAAASFGSPSQIPFFFPDRLYRDLGARIAAAMRARPGQMITLRHETGFELKLPADPIIAAIFGQIDGARSWRDIFASARNELSGLDRPDDELMTSFRPVFEQLRQYDWLLLRGASRGRYPDTIDLQAECVRRTSGYDKQAAE